jgi:hypothetical protein
MPVEITDVDDGLGNLITATGVVTDDEYVESCRRHLTQDPARFARYRFSLADFSQATRLDVSTEAIRQVVDLCIQAAEANADTVVAVVVPTDLGFGLARMWEMLSSRTSWEIRVFREVEVARSWIEARLRDRWHISHVTLAVRESEP